MTKLFMSSIIVYIQGLLCRNNTFST